MTVLTGIPRLAGPLPDPPRASRRDDGPWTPTPAQVCRRHLPAVVAQLRSDAAAETLYLVQRLAERDDERQREHEARERSREQRKVEDFTWQAQPIETTVEVSW